ncbi:MAG TPA: DUF4231 domain-containing protein [Pyrinomonadaceae bacterium]|jgi:hypothetical protein
MSESFPYLVDRLDKQADWHSKKGSLNKKRFYIAEMIALFAGAIIPIINVLSLPPAWQRAGSAILAAAIVIVTGVSKLCKFRDNWLNFRGLSEELRREKEFYLNSVGDYSATDETLKRKMLVQRTETILSTTTTRFMAVNRAEREQTTEENKT